MSLSIQASVSPSVQEPGLDGALFASSITYRNPNAATQRGEALIEGFTAIPYEGVSNTQTQLAPLARILPEIREDYADLQITKVIYDAHSDSLAVFVTNRGQDAHFLVEDWTQHPQRASENLESVIRGAAARSEAAYIDSFIRRGLVE